eukprot:PhF_6_TR24835/c0_g1_i1/m.34250/K19178/HELQ; POLQ-like helicase
MSNSDWFYGLPAWVRERYQSKGVRQLYAWQHEVLSREDVVMGTNFLYSQPTSGGKTLVSEILLLRSLLALGKSGMFILPYVSIVEEKVASFQALLKNEHYVIESYCGSSGRNPPPPGPALYICTIEKSNNVLNALFEEKRIGELGCVVVDELHMVGEQGGRGALLELLMSKLCVGARHVQIIGMSATIPNLTHLSRWIQAIAYEGQYRPITLEQHLVCGGTVCLHTAPTSVQPGSILVDDDDETSRSATLAFNRNLAAKTEWEMIVELVQECYPQHSVLVFCPTKASCVESAQGLCRALRGKPELDRTLVQEAQEQCSNVDHALLTTIPFGIAYHHSGLTGEEREFVEDSFLKKRIHVLCCTSTLAAGINLPARRVVFRTPFVGKSFLRKSQYLQMCGRAGRAGMDDKGESYLVCSSKDRHRSESLMKAAVEPIASAIAKTDPDCYLSKFVLELVACGIATSRPTILRCCERLLCHEEDPDHFHPIANMSIDLLLQNGMLSCCMADVTMQPGAAPSFLLLTALGYSVFKSCLPIPDAIQVHEELLDIQKRGLILDDDLHLCYVLTPVREMIEPDYTKYARLYSLLCPQRTRIAESLGVSEGLLQQRASGIHIPMDPACPTSRRTHFTTRRFWTALILSDLLQETDLQVVSETYNVPRGQLQALMRSATFFSSCMTSFAESMGWHSLQAVLAAYVKRLGYGVKPDLVPLMAIRGVQVSRARLLWNAGYKTVKSIAQANPHELHDKLKEAAASAVAAAASKGKANMYVQPPLKFFGIHSAAKMVSAARECLLSMSQCKKEELEELMI